MAYDDRSLRGVGGWLAFFILTLAVFGPLRAIIQTAITLYGDPSVATFYGGRWLALQVIEWSLIGVSVGISLYLGWRMYAVHVWRSVRLTILGLWLLAPVVQVIDAVAISMLADVDMREVGRAVGGEMFRGFIYAAIWTAYLLRSRRVANTYARHPASDELEAVFD